MGYSAQTFIAGEQPTTAKWNILWSNDSSFNDGTGIGSGAITFAKLLTTIFSGQVASQVNGGTAGGTIWSINLGGLKLLWVSGATVTTGSGGGITFPGSFFTTIQFYIAGMGTASGTSAVYVEAVSLTGVVSATVSLTAGAGSGTEPITFFAIGT